MATEQNTTSDVEFSNNMSPISESDEEMMTFSTPDWYHPDAKTIYLKNTQLKDFFTDEEWGRCIFQSNNAQAKKKTTWLLPDWYGYQAGAENVDFQRFS